MAYESNDRISGLVAFLAFRKIQLKHVYPFLLTFEVLNMHSVFSSYQVLHINSFPVFKIIMWIQWTSELDLKFTRSKISHDFVHAHAGISLLQILQQLDNINNSLLLGFKAVFLNITQAKHISVWLLHQRLPHGQQHVGSDRDSDRLRCSLRSDSSPVQRSSRVENCPQPGMTFRNSWIRILL